MDKVPDRKTVSVIFSCPMLSLSDFLILEDGTDRLSWFPKQLSLTTVSYLRRAQISHNHLVMQALFWLHAVQFRAIRFGWSSSVLHMWISDDFTYLRAKFKEKTSPCIQVHMVYCTAAIFLLEVKKELRKYLTWRSSMSVCLWPRISA